MKVVIESCVAINPHIIRVALYTHNDGEEYTHYEFAIPVDDFTSKEDNGTINIDGNRFQEVVSNKIGASLNVALVANILNDQDMEWELVSQPQVEPEVDTTNKDGLTLAYGNDIK